MQLSSILEEILNYDKDKGLKRSLFGDEENIQTLKKFYNQIYPSVIAKLDLSKVDPSSLALNLSELKKLDRFNQLEEKYLFQLAQIIARNTTTPGSASEKVFERLSLKFCYYFRLKERDLAGGYRPLQTGYDFMSCLKSLEARGLLTPENFDLIFKKSQIHLDIIISMDKHNHLTQEFLDTTARLKFEDDLNALFRDFPHLLLAESLGGGTGFNVPQQFVSHKEMELIQELTRLGPKNAYFVTTGKGNIVTIRAQDRNAEENKRFFVRLEEKLKEIKRRNNHGYAPLQLLDIIGSEKELEKSDIAKIKNLLFDVNVRGNMYVLEQARYLEMNKGLGYTETVQLIDDAIRIYKPRWQPPEYYDYVQPAPKRQPEASKPQQRQDPIHQPAPNAEPESTLPVHLKGFAAALNTQSQNLDIVQVGNALLKLSGINHPQDPAGFSIERNAEDNTIEITFTLNESEKRRVHDYFDRNFSESGISIAYAKKSNEPKNFTLIVTNLKEILVALKRQQVSPPSQSMFKPPVEDVNKEKDTSLRPPKKP